MSTATTARATPPATPPTIGAIGTAEPPPEEGFDVDVAEPLVIVVVTTSTRATIVGVNSGSGDVGTIMRGNTREGKGRRGGEGSAGEQEAKGIKWHASEVAHIYRLLQD
jgi:hypothetical protein